MRMSSPLYETRRYVSSSDTIKKVSDYPYGVHIYPLVLDIWMAKVSNVFCVTKLSHRNQNNA